MLSRKLTSLNYLSLNIYIKPFIFNRTHMNSKTTQNYKELTEVFQKELEKRIATSFSDSERKEIALLYNNLGHSKYMQVLFDDAVIDYTKAIEHDKSLAVAYYNRGTIYYRMGCFDDAHRDLSTAVKLESSNEEFRHGLRACEKNLKLDIA